MIPDRLMVFSVRATTKESVTSLAYRSRAVSPVSLSKRAIAIRCSRRVVKRRHNQSLKTVACAPAMVVH